MTPFQEFRYWIRRAPAGERSAAAMAGALALVVLVWVLIPSSSTGTPSSLATDFGGSSTGTTGTSAPGTSTTGTGGTTAPTTGTSGTAATGATGTLPGTATSGSATSGTTGGIPTSGGATSAGTTGGGQACPAGNGPGVSASRLKIAVILVNIVGPAANSLFGISTPAQQQAFFEAAIKDANASGGAGCRQITAQYFKGNPTDQNNLNQICLDIQAAGVAAVLDGGAYAQYPLVDCYARAGIPYFGGYLISGTQQQKYFPYLFEFNTLDRLYKDAVLALKARGFFDKAKGFQMLGFVYRDCDPTMISNQKRLLASIVGSAMVSYNVGCPSALANPADIQQAVLSFQRAGVTHVTTASFVGDFASFTKTAQQQKFTPRYGLADDSLVALSYGSQAPDPDNIADAVAISAGRSAEETTPGTKPSAGTVRCNAAFKKYGNLGNVYKLPYGSGNSCALVSMFDAAADHAPVLQRNAFAAGLQRAKSVEMSFPQGPNDFTGNRITTGGQYWRPLQFHLSCKCWQITNRTFSRSFS
ncbi:MAG: hypothetical protein ABR549_02780 [Mycobacteriales bacterium]